MRLTIKSYNTEVIVELPDPQEHPFSKYTGDTGNNTQYDKPFERLIELVKVSANKVIDMENKQYDNETETT